MIDSTLDQPGAGSVPDEVLMKDISRRRHDALTELYGRHSKRLRATIDGVVHEEAEADDVLQEIFLQVWEEAGRYSPKAGKPLGWMVTIARRRAIDRLRRRQAYCRARDRYEKRVIQDSQTPRRDASRTLVLNDLHHFLKKTTRSRGVGFLQGIEPQGNCRRDTRSAWNGKDATRTGVAKTDSRAETVAAQSVTRPRGAAASERNL